MLSDGDTVTKALRQDRVSLEGGSAEAWARALGCMRWVRVLGGTGTGARWQPALDTDGRL